MPRPSRIKYPGAAYHVMARGNQGRAIFEDDQDRQRFLETLGGACEKTAVVNTASRQDMPWNAANRFLADRANRVNASVRTGRHFCIRSVAKVGLQIVHRWGVVGCFPLLQRPLLFGGVKEPEIVDARIHVLRFRILGLQRR